MFFSSEYESQLHQLLPTSTAKEPRAEEGVEGVVTPVGTVEEGADEDVVKNNNCKNVAKTPGKFRKRRSRLSLFRLTFLLFFISLLILLSF